MFCDQVLHYSFLKKYYKIPKNYNCHFYFKLFKKLKKSTND